jgi:flagellin
LILLNGNISSLNTQRHLNNSTSRLQDIFKSLSTGLRINSAKDDPAGLMMASSLAMDRRVYAQGIRNINDGVSHFNIVEGAASELKNILFRLSELSSQASNGTLGNSQRQALNSESESLIEEYSRIIKTAEFNGRNVFSEEAKTIRIQAGYGESGTIPVSIEGEGFSAVTLPTGDGTFGASASFAAGS